MKTHRTWFGFRIHKHQTVSLIRIFKEVEPSAECHEEEGMYLSISVLMKKSELDSETARIKAELKRYCFEPDIVFSLKEE